MIYAKHKPKHKLVKWFIISGDGVRPSVRAYVCNVKDQRVEPFFQLVLWLVLRRGSLYDSSQVMKFRTFLTLSKVASLGVPCIGGGMTGMAGGDVGSVTGVVGEGGIGVVGNDGGGMVIGRPIVDENEGGITGIGFVGESEALLF